MSQEIEIKYQRLRSIFFGLCIIAAVMLFLSSTRNMAKSSAAASWPVHTGVVTNEMRGGFSSGYYGGRWLTYRYEIDGREFRGTRVGFGISRPPAGLKNGDQIPVYVNPEDNNQAVVAVGINKSHFIGLVFSFGFGWLGMLIWRRTV